MISLSKHVHVVVCDGKYKILVALCLVKDNESRDIKYMGVETLNNPKG